MIQRFAPQFTPGKDSSVIDTKTKAVYPALSKRYAGVIAKMMNAAYEIGDQDGWKDGVNHEKDGQSWS